MKKMIIFCLVSLFLTYLIAKNKSNVSNIKNLKLNDFSKKIENPDFIFLNQNNYETIYEDVISQSKKSFGNQHGRSTNVHETAHIISSRERNKFKKEMGDCNVFYCLKGRIVVLKEPNSKISDVFVPKELRSYRYNLYFKEQLKYWNDSPTYILEEWSAYILGAECALDDHNKKIHTEKSDAVSGCLEFSIYAVATSMMIKEKNPEYWEKENNFKKFMVFNLKRAENAFYTGKDIFKFKKQDELLNNLRNSKEAKELRRFMKNEFGDFFLH